VHSPFAALRERDFRLFWLGAFAGTVGFEMQGTAVGWELYERTHDNLTIAFVGLVQVLPVLVLFVPSGVFVDRNDRRFLTTVCALLTGVVGVAPRRGVVQVGVEAHSVVSARMRA